MPKLSAEQLEQRRHLVRENKRTKLRATITEALKGADLEVARNVLSCVLYDVGEKWKDGHYRFWAN